MHPAVLAISTLVESQAREIEELRASIEKKDAQLDKLRRASESMRRAFSGLSPAAAGPPAESTQSSLAPTALSMGTLPAMARTLSGGSAGAAVCNSPRVNAAARKAAMRRKHRAKPKGLTLG
jgi:hypothetical protein